MNLFATLTLALGEEWTLPSFEGASFTTYGGLAILVTALIGGLKMILRNPWWMTGSLYGVAREIPWVIGFTFAIGIAVKALHLSFPVPWPAHLLGLVGAVVGSKILHDGMTSPLGKVILGFLRKKGDGTGSSV